MASKWVLKKLLMLLDGALLSPTYLGHFCVTDHGTVYVGVVPCETIDMYISYSRLIDHVGYSHIIFVLFCLLPWRNHSMALSLVSLAS